MPMKISSRTGNYLKFINEFIVSFLSNLSQIYQMFLSVEDKQLYNILKRIIVVDLKYENDF